MAVIFVSPEAIGHLRLLMSIGFVCAVILLALLWNLGKPRPQRRSITYCPIHRGDRNECTEQHHTDA